MWKWNKCIESWGLCYSWALHIKVLNICKQYYVFGCHVVYIQNPSNFYGLIQTENFHLSWVLAFTVGTHFLIAHSEEVTLPKSLRWDSELRVEEGHREGRNSDDLGLVLLFSSFILKGILCKYCITLYYICIHIIEDQWRNWGMFQDKVSILPPQGEWIGTWS